MNNTLNRRSFLGLSVAAGAVGALGAPGACSAPPAATGQQGRILSTDPLIADIEAGRAASGATVTATLTPAPRR